MCKSANILYPPVKLSPQNSSAIVNIIIVCRAPFCQHAQARRADNSHKFTLPPARQNCRIRQSGGEKFPRRSASMRDYETDIFITASLTDRLPFYRLYFLLVLIYIVSCLRSIYACAALSYRKERVILFPFFRNFRLA